MKLWLYALVTIAVQSPALACECVWYKSDVEMVDSEIKHLRTASVGLDGIVTSSSTSLLGTTTTIVRPDHVWFGIRLKEYRIENFSNCDLNLSTGEKVRITLNKIQNRTDLLSNFYRRIFGDNPKFSASGCSNFALAMRYPKMRKAVYLRSQDNR